MKNTGAPSRKKLIKYFKKLAKVSGKASQQAIEKGRCYEDGQAYYSLYWYFRSCITEDLNPDNKTRYAPVLDAYLGANLKELLKPKGPSPKDIEKENELLSSLFPLSKYPLNKNQIEAVHKALHFPVSIIKGPPGTGKTETILRIVALALHQGETVAVTSTNSAAVINVEEKVAETLSAYGEVTKAEAENIAQTDLAFAAACKHASLGSKTIRENACDPITKANFAFEAGEHLLSDGSKLTGWELNKTFDEFTQQFPFITSTIHSLKKCFCDGEQKKYDLLIMDEASQTNLIAGIVALSCAKRVVLVGDEEQLPPVITDEDQSTAKQLAKKIGVFETKKATSPYDTARQDFSFLESCYEVFCTRNPDLRTMLTDHYRCHPAIIGFCNKAIYDNNLHVATTLSGNDPACPISVLWYEGDYRERVLRPAPPREEEPNRKYRATCVNRKQMAIMRAEEGPRLRRYVQEGKSICILSPFNGQIRLLQTYIQDLLSDVLAPKEIALETDGLETTSESDTNNEHIYTLTIHKSQGQEFDVVYLLPVEDGNWEWPWSQGRRLVNVAASRAKKELRIILSTKLMSPKTQEWLTGRQAYVNKPAKPQDDPGNQQMFVRKLIDYTKRSLEALPDLAQKQNEEAGFGFNHSRIVSVFDEIPFLQNPKAKSDFAPEQCLKKALNAMNLPNLAWAEHVTFDCLRINDRARGVKLSEFIGDEYERPAEAHFDFVIFDKKTRKLYAALEVDGSFHRFPRKKKEEPFGQFIADDRKDYLIKNACGAALAWLGPMQDGSFVRNIAGLTLRIQEGDWVHSPAEIESTSSFVFLRIPSDGSTFWETDALRVYASNSADDTYPQKEVLQTAGAFSCDTNRPTIEDFVRIQQLASSREGTREFYVGNEVVGHNFCNKATISDGLKVNSITEEYLGISACLEKWREDNELATLLSGVRAQTMNQCLLEAGFHYLQNGNPKMRAATKLGESIGIRTREGIGENDDPYLIPVYSREARQFIATHLKELLEGKI